MSDLGRYRLLRRIGQGGMAEVFEALAVGGSGFQRRVAVKRILPAFSNIASFGRMFLDEARIASSLHHANIVGVLDYGEAEGLPFQVLDLVDGVNLNDLMSLAAEADIRLPTELALYICMEVAHGLEYAHRACDLEGRPLGIVHRDVKPGNILAAWSGDIKLTDFGIAFARDRSERTSLGGAKGTHLYMAPEQLLQGKVDGRTDVFALGCVLQGLVGRESPLAHPEAMARLLTGRDLELDPSLPEDVRAIVAHATRGAMEARYRDAAAMASALGSALAHRMDHDAKSLMREWLTIVRPGPTVERVGRLDALVDVELVLQSTENDVRRFGTSKPTLPDAEAQDRPPAPARSPSRARRLGLVLALVVAASSAGAGLWRFTRPEATRRVALPAAPARDAMAPVASAASPDPAERSPAESSPPPRREPAAQKAPRGNRGSHREAPSARARAPSLLGLPRDEVGTPGGEPPAAGVVVVGGEGALQSEILVDGQSRGFAPKRLELALGKHTLELLTRDGRRLGPHPISLTSRHTPNAPLRWMVPAPP